MPTPCSAEVTISSNVDTALRQRIAGADQRADADDGRDRLDVASQARVQGDLRGSLRTSDVGLAKDRIADWLGISHERSMSLRSRDDALYAGSCSRLAIIALNAGRAWQASSQALTRGAAENSSGAAIA